MVIDFSRGGRPIGIEITAPDKVTLAAINRVLRALGCSPVRRADLAPLRAA
jgi:tRNA threonylcarbamoyladenosine modification (KEOPS) complex  Pcc1 subunit